MSCCLKKVSDSFSKLLRCLKMRGNRIFRWKIVQDNRSINSRKLWEKKVRKLFCFLQAALLTLNNVQFDEFFQSAPLTFCWFMLNANNLVWRWKIRRSIHLSHFFDAYFCFLGSAKNCLNSFFCQEQCFRLFDQLTFHSAFPFGLLNCSSPSIGHSKSF